MTRGFTPVKLDDDGINVLSFLEYHRKGIGNENNRERMKLILSRAIGRELTQAQRDCLTDYYLLGKKQKEIAKQRGLSASTVCRHIKAARRKLHNIADYYFN